jgi:hypothetical protein
MKTITLIFSILFLLNLSVIGQSWNTLNSGSTSLLRSTYFVSNYDGWAVMEWECCIKSPEQGAREGSKFIADHIIEVTEKTFDDFAGGEVDENMIKQIIGI